MRSLIAAVSFLTVLPIGRNMYFSEQEMGRSQVWFPLVGLILGGICAAACYLLYYVGFEFAADATAVMLLVLLTGGLHLDGLMDTADGLGCNKDREQKLAVMKDGRVGAMGVLAALVVLLLKAAYLYEISPPEKYFWLMLAPAVSRACMLYAINNYPYARKRGTGATFANHTGKYYLPVAFLIICALTLFVYPYGLIAVGMTFMFAVLTAKYITQKLGGLTGDCYGAITELTETAVFMLGALLCKCL